MSGIRLVWSLVLACFLVLPGCGSSGVGDGGAFAGGGDLLGVDGARKLVEAGADSLDKFVELLAARNLPADYFICSGKYLQTVNEKGWRACGALGAYSDPYERRVPGYKILTEADAIVATWARKPKLVLATMNRSLPGAADLPLWPASCPEAVNLACVNPADSTEVFLLYERIGTRKTKRSDVAGYLLHELLHLMTGKNDEYVFTIVLAGDPSKRFPFTAQTLFTLEGMMVQSFIEDFPAILEFEKSVRTARGR